MYRIEVAPEAQVELRHLRAFYARPVFRAIDDLHQQAQTESRHRRPLEEPLDVLPDATWEVRVGSYRVLYGISGLTVRVLRVILKGRETMREALRRGGR